MVVWAAPLSTFLNKTMYTYFLKNKDVKSDVDQAKDDLKKSDEARDNTFDSWIIDSEDEDEEGEGKED